MSDDYFRGQLQIAEIIPKTLQLVSLSSSLVGAQYERGDEVVAEAAKTMRSLLMSCLKESINEGSTPPYKILGDVSVLIKNILEKDKSNRDFLDYCMMHLKESFEVNMRCSPLIDKILALFLVLLEVRPLIKKSSPPISSSWEIMDRLSASAFIEDILLKLIKQELTVFSSVKQRNLIRIRDLLRCLSLCLPSLTDANRVSSVDSTLANLFESALSTADPLSAEKFDLLYKQVTFTSCLPSTKEAFDRNHVITRRLADVEKQLIGVQRELADARSQLRAPIHQRVNNYYFDSSYSK